MFTLENTEKAEVNMLLSMIEKTDVNLIPETIVEGPVIGVKRSSIFVDLGVFGTGIIYGKEFINAKDIIKKTKIGDIVKAKVIEQENENGYIELSLKEAKQALIWNEAEESIKNKTIFNLAIKEANKGGLILEWQGLDGFLPASQLKSEHYPRVLDGNKEKILKELRKLIGEKMKVIIIGVNQKESKLIFSEKNIDQEDIEEKVSKYKIGDELECEITGIVDFGLFLKIEEGLEGLVHISEIDWGLVEDLRNLYKVEDKVKAKIIEIKDGKISLSIKVLKENPWKEFENKLKKGDIVSGVVIKFNKHGALVSIKEGVAGLVHNSTFDSPGTLSSEQNSDAKLRKTLELGKTYNFQITLFEPKNQRMMLTYLEQTTK